MNNTNENNKLIAEFIGLELEETLNGRYVYARKEQSDTKLNDIKTEFYQVNELKYHISWDWLQPVIKKCLQKKLSKTITNAQKTNNIHTTYKAVIEFIKNQNN